MIKYYPKLTLTFSEIPGAPTLLIHAFTGCPFHCFHCFNFQEIINNPQTNYYLIADVLSYIEKQKDLFGYIVFSGGEYLNTSLEDLKHDLKMVREITDTPIIIYTNGSHPEKMLLLHRAQLVDGFHTDMKLPYHLLDNNDHELIELTLGIKVDDIEFFRPHLQALELTVKLDRGYSRIRSVRYPFLGESAFEENRLFVEKLNRKYHKKTPYDVNPFIYPEE
jgi:pyruvate formate lyase activating enzyme